MLEQLPVIGNLPYITSTKMISGDRTKTLMVEFLPRYQEAIKEDPERVLNDIKEEVRAFSQDSLTDEQEFNDSAAHRFYWNAQFLTLEDLMEIAECLKQ